MDLNPQQQEAVEHEGGPLLIVAGAGSGKTRTLTERLLYLLRKGIAPASIIALTFTNKAAHEMKERITRQLPRQNTLPFLGTFHSLGVRILREETPFERTPQFSIFDEDDALGAMKAVLKSAGFSREEYNPLALRGTLSKIKNELIDLDTWEDEEEQRIFQNYETFLRDNNAFDFDDLIHKVVTLFMRQPQTLKKYRDRFRYILIDEYQDVNPVQYMFVKLLAEEHRNLSVVGDDAQAIYGWRSADMKNFLRFEDDWLNAKVVLLEQNYRSTKTIISAASALIANNVFQKQKNLWTDNEAGSLIGVVRAENSEEEAAFIAESIAGRRAHDRKKSIAILYRTNAQSRALEQALIVARIPYHIFGGLKFYERKEIKDIVAALRIAANPKDLMSHERILKTLPVARARILILRMAGLGSTQSLLELISLFLHEAEYFNYLERKFPNAQERKENIAELISFAGTFPTLTAFLEQVSLMQSSDRPSTNSTIPQFVNSLPVELMTIHLAKGLEFDHVTIAGTSEGTLPHHRSYGTQEELEEERRLMYVAMTRARQSLLLTFFHIPSRFLYELPPELVTFTDLSGKRKTLPDEDEIYLE